MDIRLLGTVEASVDGRAVAVGPGKPRALLALLALHAGSTVSSERLIDGLWGEPPPATAPKLVQLHVSQLRKALGARATILTRGHGYELRLGPDDLDVTRFERLVAAGRAARGARPVARPAARRRRRRAVRGRRDRPARGAAAGGGRAGDRARPGRGPAPRGASASSSGSWSRSRCARRCTRSGCWRCTAPAGRPTRSRRTATPGRCWSSGCGVEPGPELRRLHEAILRQDAALAATPLVARRVAGGEPHRGRAPGAAAVEDDLAGSVFELQAARAQRRPRKRRRRLPVQGPGVVRRRGRRVLLRPRAARRRAGRAAHRRPADGHRRRRPGSGKSSALRAGLLPRSRPACCPAASAGRSPCCAPASTRCERSRRATARSRRPAGRRRRPVRGALHGLPRRGRACGVRRRAVPSRDPRRRAIVLIAVRADFYGRCARLPGARAAARREPRARRADAPRRAAPRDRAARRARRAGGRARARRCAARRRRGPARRAAAAVHRAARAVAAPRRAPAAHGRLRARRRRAGRGRAAGRARLRAARARAACRWRAAILLRLARRRASVRRRVPLDELDGERRRGPRRARRRPPGHDRRGRGRGGARGAAARVAAAARLARGGRAGAAAARAPARGRARVGGRGRDPSELYRGARLAAVLDWVGRARGELNAAERDFVAASRAASQRSQRRLRAVRGRPRRAARAGGRGRAWSRSTSAATPAREATAAEAQRLGARALVEDDLDLSLLLARQGVALDDSPQTRGEPAGGAAQEPGRDRRAARRRRPR